MAETPFFKSLRRVLPDALVGLGVFAATLMLTLGDTSMAASYAGLEIDAVGPFVPGLGDRLGASLLVAATFAVIVTLDLAFVRHVVRTYSVPSRRVARRRDLKIALLARDTEL